MTRQDDEDEVMARRFDWALRELNSAEQAPDVTARVLTRAAAGEVVNEGPLVHAPPWRRGFTAAAFLLGLGLVAAVFLLEHWSARHADEFAQEPRSEWVAITTVEQIDALASDTLAVELLDLADEAVKRLVNRCPRLRALRIHTSKAYAKKEGGQSLTVSITDAAFEDIARLSGLRRLELIRTDEVDGAGLHRLEALPLLTTLHLRRFDLSDNALLRLPRLPALQHLDLSWNHGFGESSVKVVASCLGLRTLSLHGCSQLHATWLKSLGKLSRLTVLDLGEIGDRWRGFLDLSLLRQHLEARTKLMDESKRIRAGLTLEGLAGWPELEVLRLSGCKQLESGLGEFLVRTCPMLRELDLSGSPLINDETITQVLQLKHLRCLDLSGCHRLKSATGLALVEATQLRDIRLDNLRWMDLELADAMLLNGQRVRCLLSEDELGVYPPILAKAPAFNAGMRKLRQRYAELFETQEIERGREEK